MKKILLLSTGGTIASVPSGEGLAPGLTGEKLLEGLSRPDIPFEVHCRELMSLDSSNLQPEHWSRMAEAVFSALPLCDGVVISHGTDTMAYTAAALSFMLQNLNKPVILTGSQLPMDAPESDGPKNLSDALACAADGRLHGVYIVFDGLVIRGVNARKTDTRKRHAFESVNAAPAGRLEKGRLFLNGEPKPPAGLPLTLNANVSPGVLLMKLTPGASPALLEAAPGLGFRAVLLEAFGLGGIPGLDRSLLPSIHALSKQGIPVAVTSQCAFGDCDLSVYDVGVQAAKAGALCAGPMLTETAIVKLSWILGQTKDYRTMVRLFLENLAGEFDKNNENPI